MTIIKLSSSGKQLQVVDDFGNVYATSLVYAKMLLDNKLPKPFILCSRLPNKVSASRFGLSPVWNPDNRPVAELVPGTSGEIISKDSFSNEVRDSNKVKVNIEDKVVW